MKELKIDLPLTVTLPRKTKADKKVIINLNNYPHWHYMTYNQVKKIFKEILEPTLNGLKIEGKMTIQYTLFKGSNRRSDKMNVGAVQDKFFCDALTECGCIEDDNDDVIESQAFRKTQTDIKNPRVEALITCDNWTKKI